MPESWFFSVKCIHSVYSLHCQHDTILSDKHPGEGWTQSWIQRREQPDQVDGHVVEDDEQSMEELDVEGGPARGVPHKDIDDRGQAVPEAFIAASADHAGYLVNLDVGELEAADVDLKEVVEELLGGADEDAHDVGAISRQTKIKVS